MSQEPFPSISFPAFTNASKFAEESGQLWITTTTEEVPWGGTGIRPRTESILHARAVDRLLSGELTTAEARWLAEVAEASDAVCRLEVRSTSGNVLASVRSGEICG